MTADFTDTAKTPQPDYGATTRNTGILADTPKMASEFAPEEISGEAPFTNFPKTQRTWGDIPIEEVADYTFQSVVLMDGTTVENVTFETLVDLIWRNQTKH